MLFLDALVLKIWEGGSVQRKACYLALGVTVEGDRDLAIVNAVPAWTRTRNWTTALLAFKIHFGDRLPE